MKTILLNLFWLSVTITLYIGIAAILWSISKTLFKIVLLCVLGVALGYVLLHHHL